jgi:hypothetical protein
MQTLQNIPPSETEELIQKAKQVIQQLDEIIKNQEENLVIHKT